MRSVSRIISYLLIVPVKIYQWFISPLLPNSCRHVPTCSNYAIEALKIHGPFKGSYLAIRRILRCHPWGTHGYDPVPEKRNKLKDNIAIVAMLVLLVSLISCKTNTSESNFAEIAVSIAPQKYIIDKLTNDSRQVLTLIPSGANPHTYELTVKQVEELSRVKIYFQIGHFSFEEAWGERFKTVNNDMKIVSLDNKFINCHEEHSFHKEDRMAHSHIIDPHVWMSVKNMQEMTTTIYEELSELFEGDSVKLLANYKTLQEELNNADSIISAQLADFKGKKLFVYHPSLTYFSRDYGLKQIALEEDGKEPTIKHLKKIFADDKSDIIPVIFIQKEIDVDNILVISRELNWPVIEINPLEYNISKEILHISNTIFNVSH